MEEISKLVDLERKNLLSLLSELVAKNTTNPPGNEYLAAKVIQKFFEKNRITYETFEKKKGRTNIVGYIGKGSPKLIIACHSDVVPPGDGWKTNPFKLVIKGGKVFGRGVLDNKGPLACALIAGKILKKFEKHLKGQVLIACVADEERGSNYGMKYLLNEGKIRGDYAIVPDVETHLKRIDTGEKGLLFLRIISFGKQAHGSKPERGVNAIWNMIDFLNEFRKYEMVSKDPDFTKPTKNLGLIRGGIAPNVVPARCEVNLDIRYLPSQQKNEIVKDIKRIIKNVKRKNKKARFKLEIIDDQPPFKLRRGNVLVKSLKKSTLEILGFEAKEYGSSGTTVAKPLARKGMVAVGFGAGGNVAHMANEFCEIQELVDLAKILCLTSLDLLK
jgi:acetylornithine deacetylase/succinyl-diaminopimelate desuccinylase family protein